MLRLLNFSQFAESYSTNFRNVSVQVIKNYYTVGDSQQLANNQPSRWKKCLLWDPNHVGQDPREGIFLYLGLIVSWLLAVTYSITFHVYIIMSTVSKGSLL